MAFTDDEIRAWIDREGGSEQGLDALDRAYRQGQFAGDRERAVGAYLHNQRERRAAEQRVLEQGLAGRSVAAAESQANTAKQALERSNIAIIVSIVAILLAAFDMLTRR